jgi:hypothetical protein
MYDVSKVEVDEEGEDSEPLGVPDAGKLVFIGKGLGEKVRQSLKSVVGS